MRDAKTAGRARKRLEWREAIYPLSTDETRSYVVGQLSGAGFSVESFAHKTEARQVVADALTRIEDDLEPRARAGSKAAEMRDAVRLVRRRLELELWP